VSFLLDTCAVSELVRPRPDAGLVEWLSGQEETTLFLSALTLGELTKGVARLDESARRERLQRWLDEDLQQRFAERVLAVDGPVAREWGALQGAAQRRGETLPVIDSLLAATARVHDLTVVTHNVEDLRRSGAQVTDPWSGE